MRGYAAIGLMEPKTAANIGSVLRAAFNYDAALVVIEGDRSVPVRACTDTLKAYRHLPVIHGNLKEQLPYDCVPVAVDLVPDATPLPSFQHPQRAFYIFGPEDGTLDEQTLSWCRHRVMVPTRNCMNLAAAVNVVLYDRMAKANRMERGVELSKEDWSKELRDHIRQILIDRADPYSSWLTDKEADKIINLIRDNDDPVMKKGDG